MLFQFETKDRIARVFKVVNGNKFAKFSVTVESKKTLKVLQRYTLAYLPKFSSFTALVKYAKEHDLPKPSSYSSWREYVRAVKLSLSTSEQSNSSETVDCVDSGKSDTSVEKQTCEHCGNELDYYDKQHFDSCCLHCWHTKPGILCFWCGCKLSEDEKIRFEDCCSDCHLRVEKEFLND